jgi:hypothetical protein
MHTASIRRVRAVVAIALALLALLAAPITAAQQEPPLQLLSQPRRLVDTRAGSGYQGAGQPLTGFTQPRCFQIAGEGDVPFEAVGVVTNLTAVDFSVDGWITLFPAGAAVPDTSNLNFDTVQNAVANMAMVPLGQNGQVCAVGQPGTSLILDVLGYFGRPMLGLTCPTATTLELLVDCIVDRSGMRDRTGVYVIPTESERAEFGNAVRAMLVGVFAFFVLGTAVFIR